MSSMSSSLPEPIAIVGSGCRFPGGANSPSILWELLESPRDVCQEIPPDRFNTTGFFHHDGARHGTTNVRHTYLLQEDVRVFDAAFFNISPNEADSIDPQQRLLLETVYEALEAGGLTIDSLRGSNTSVYVGTMGVDYHETLLRDLNTIPTYFATGTNRAIISNRVSYFFDWHGPSMTIDTACSSSMFAVHQGVQSLRNGESRVSVACGTQIILGHEMYIVESKLKMLSPTGRSRMWDASADGYARGEGIAVIVMKRLSDAIIDGDHIECVIRETGVNQDGFSNGITVPNTQAQTALIRDTYARAGLDPENNPNDRPQFFEAHGTGTQAGDPKEAAAIHEAFGQYIHATNSAPLFVGSIKTVVGHLEGAAGLAGILKASASIQNGLIPPNLLFDKLNPRVEPFYKGLYVPTTLTAWPKLPEGVFRRASVNSFGFGGANAHAILEEHIQPDPHARGSSRSLSLTPFVFSAVSETSLVALLEKYSKHLKSHQNQIDASDLSWTLHTRRSQFPVRASFSALSLQQLASKIDSKLATIKQNITAIIGTRTTGKPLTPRILGVFTGQGAQWPAMGAQLIRSSCFVRQKIQHLQESLATLPTSDRPPWRLQDEMLAGADTSRIAEAALSQPLCTAIQIVLVDLLKAAGITFAAVVGHSSGEIAAAYAAGFLSAHDAIRVAYYRGFYAKLAGNHINGQAGAMLAVGTSYEDAQELVSLEIFKGRLAFAAHNSSASVTLSGDKDAIIHAKKIFDEEKKFTRVLKVDTAYHSHHMLPCSDSYVDALQACGVRVNRDQSNACVWYSSVMPNAQRMEPSPELEGVYWRDNMTNTVLFADAIKNALCNDDQISLALEIGPHPALKGPAMQSISELRTAGLPYSGVLNRGNDDIESFADALGFVWTFLGAKGVDLQSYEKTVVDEVRSHKLILGLPSYQWTHGRIHWSESRLSRKLRGSKQAPHELLGALMPDSNAHEIRWSNILKVSEIPWLEGHQLQGQTVFPAAGYVAMALEASRVMAAEKAVKTFELHNLSIPRAITFEDGDTLGVETLITLTAIEYHHDELITANFRIYSCPNISTGSEQDMELMAKGNVSLSLGNPEAETLSFASVEDYNMSVVEPERFYAALSKLGYGYSGSFRGMLSMKRRLNQSSALVNSYAYGEDESTLYLVHPSMLDVAFQSSMLAYSAPGDDRLWSLHIPTAIRTIRVNPEVCASLPSAGTQVPVFSTLNCELESFFASIDLLSEDGRYSMIQVEDLVIKPFAPPTKADDRRLFSYTKFDLAAPNGSSIMKSIRPSVSKIELATACERISYYYIRKWKLEITDSEWVNGQPYHLHLRDFVNHTISEVSNGQHPTIQKEWGKDTAEDIRAMISQHANAIDVKLLSAVGDNIPAAIRGQTTILEHMLPNGLLDDFYRYGLGFARYNLFLASMMKQVAHRYPHTKILEIGAGTGGATKSILASIGNSMSSYTYTDISVGFFTRAAEVFKAHSSKMTFKILNVEDPPTAQGFEPHSYDIIVASNVLHATASLEKTLAHTRQLLRPGGYLMLLEITDNDPIRCSTIMGGLSGWWLGVEDGRKYAPTATPGDWHLALRKAGFGGIDTITPKVDGPAWPFSIIAAQAVDDRVLFLRRPLSSPASSISIENLVIIGGKNLHSARITEEVGDSLYRFCGKVTMLSSLPTKAEALALGAGSTFINMADLDSPIFKTMTAASMDGLKRVFEKARHVLWLTHGALTEEPYHMASLAFCRSISNEFTHISLNQLDISDLYGANVSKVISEQLLRQCALEEWDQHQLCWSKEPETFLDEGKLMLPRLVHNMEQNDRLNSSRRVITKMVPVLESNFSIEQGAGLPTSVVENVSPMSATKYHGQMRVHKSTLMALHITSDSFLFLAICQSEKDGHFGIALLASNSCVAAPIAFVPADIDQGEVHLPTSTMLPAIAAELVAKSVLQNLHTGTSLLVTCSEKDNFIAAALSHQAADRDIRVTFSYDADDSNDAQVHDPSWIRLTARVPRHVLRKVLAPMQPTHFLDLTSEFGTSSTNLNKRILEILPSGSKKIDASGLFREKASVPSSYDKEILSEWLQDAVASARASTACLAQVAIEDIMIELNQINESAFSKHRNSIVHWPVEGNITVEVRPLNTQALFSKEKTYILFGLSGQTGQSLCDWMVSNGAGCVCLTSRHPNIDQRWLDSFKDTQATVKIFPMDVSDKTNVDSVVMTIRQTCPPIAGVANGAMVLNDMLFGGMTFEAMQDVLRPKIDGSHHLDQAFYDDDLDFFVLLSSGAWVVGNSGQANYAAANGYLNGLVRQRRRRGLAASAFDIGLVSGIGYVENARELIGNKLNKYGMTVLSETDFRIAFAETIQAGYPKRGDQDTIPDAVVTTGIRTMRDGETDVVWYNNPIFSHCIIEDQSEEVVANDNSKNKVAALPVAERLAKTATKEDAFQVLKESFAAKLRIILQSSDQEINYDAPLVDLGIDSLVAVEVRSWFLKELKVDVPVLKIVGGATLAEVCEQAIKKLPEELSVKIGTGNLASQPPLSAVTSESPPSPPSLQPSSTETSSSSASVHVSTPGLPTPPRVDTPVSSISQASSQNGQPQLPPDFAESVNVLTNSDSREIAGPCQAFSKSESISLGQSRFWFLRLLVEDETKFNVTFKYHLHGRIRVGDLEDAIRVVTARHEALRTCFIGDTSEADEASQNILTASKISLERKRVSSKAEVATEYKKLQSHQFDLASGQLLRVLLLTLSPSSHFILVNYHHIIMDGFSFQVIFMSELDKIYNGQALGTPPRQYPDFSVAQRRALEQGEMKEELLFWKGVFPAGEEPPVLPLLPMARATSRMNVTDYEHVQVTTQLEPTLVTRIRSVARSHRSTPFHFFLAAFKTMLFSFTDTEDITIGIADANRNDSDVMNSIGFYLNLLALRFHRQANQNFSSAIVEARNTAYAALENSRLPFDVLLKELNVTRSSSYSPFFQAFFDYRQISREKQTWCNCQLNIKDAQAGTTAYDISVDVLDNTVDAHIVLKVQKGIYDMTAAKLLLETYMHFIDVLSQDPSLSLEDTPLFSEEQLARGIEVGRGPDLVSTWPLTLPHRIDQIALENPNEIALVDGLGNSFAYNDMIKRVEAISKVLLDSGIGTGSRVLVFQQASCDWICSMLAIMRSGGVYVPLDLRNPVARLADLANDCQPSAVLVDSTTVSDAPQLNTALVIDISGIASASSTRVPNAAQPDSPAAVLYTSGSTGTPKGIIIKHSGICNEMEGYTKTWKLGAERVLQQSAFTFDFSMDQIFTGLVNGGMVYIVPWSQRGDPLSITEIIQQQSITYTKATPSEYSLLIQYGYNNLRKASKWRSAFAGGEPLTNTILRQFVNLSLPLLRLHNSYGPAEISIASHKMLIDYYQERTRVEEPVPCGFSLPNYATYILDEHQRPLPVGMPGEVVIGGAGVSLGYLANQELTDQHFITNPYVTEEYINNGWLWMHRTGDIGHLQEDGSLVFRNRKAGDTQVKLRGLRIDLRDIETNIIAASGGVLKEAVVTLREGDPDFLVAHVVFASSSNIKSRDIFLEHLLGRLPIPQYMIPLMAIPLDEIPLNSHSKVDRRAVMRTPLPQRIAVNRHNDNELTDTMTQLRILWWQVLGKNSEKLGIVIGPSTNFFLVGGNSLLVVRLQSKIREVFNIAIRLADLLTASTLGTMARKIEDSTSVDLIDWEQETSPPSTPSFLRLKDASLGAFAGTREDTKTLLVTGATGNVAMHLLPLLSANPAVGKIHCVAVRGTLPPHSQKLVPSEKIFCHTGDLSTPLFGLSEDEFQALSDEVDVILHMGAMRSFWDNYHLLRPSNVDSTKELVKLATPRQIPIHFISTSGVLPRKVLHGPGVGVTGASAAAIVPPVDGTDGYIASKWACERILERSTASLGIPSFVYRLLPSNQATLDDLEQEVITEFLRCIDIAGQMPETVGWEGRLDLVPAKLAARWLCESVLRGDSMSQVTGIPAATRTQFYHFESPTTFDLVKLSKRIQEERGDRGLELLPPLKWMGRMKSLGFSYILASQEITFKDRGEGDSEAPVASRR